MKRVIASLFVLLFTNQYVAAECLPQRTIVIDTRDYPMVGKGQYKQTLPLQNKEIVLTFDDGPNKSTTESVLNTLDKFCLKATFFVVGSTVKANPTLLKKIADSGHTVGNHTYYHSMPFDKLSYEKQYIDIENGNWAIQEAIGDKASPIFRFPGLGRTHEAEQYLHSRGFSVWSVDIETKDYKFSHLKKDQALNNILGVMNASLRNNNSGMLLMHDIHRTTAEALPYILSNLASRGYTFAHVKTK